MRVTYRSAQLVSTGRYENRRFEYELSAELAVSATQDDLQTTRLQLKRTVDNWILDDITKLLYGDIQRQRIDEEAEREKLRRSVAKRYNLAYDDGGDGNGNSDATTAYKVGDD